MMTTCEMYWLADPLAGRSIGNAALAPAKPPFDALSLPAEHPAARRMQQAATLQSALRTTPRLLLSLAPVTWEAAVMLLEPGEASGPLANEHPQSEQVLFAAEGTVEAEIGDNRFTMKSGGARAPLYPHYATLVGVRSALSDQTAAPP